MPDIETVLRKIIEQTRNRNIKWKELEVGFEANIKEARIVFDSSGIFWDFYLYVYVPYQICTTIESRDEHELMDALFFAIDEQFSNSDGGIAYLYKELLALE